MFAALFSHLWWKITKEGLISKNMEKMASYLVGKARSPELPLDLPLAYLYLAVEKSEVRRNAKK